MVEAKEEELETLEVSRGLKFEAKKLNPKTEASLANEENETTTVRSSPRYFLCWLIILQLSFAAVP